jgi:hypothetical protein
MSATYTAARPAGIAPVVGHGTLATLIACAATPIAAAAGQAIGISLDVGGAPIPFLGFSTLTAFFSLIGVVLATVLSKVARHPRTAFVRTTVVLTALSFVPDVLAPAATATKAVLMLTHVVAAAIVIPAVARKLAA